MGLSFFCLFCLLILVNAGYILVVLAFERKKIADDLRRRINWKTRELKWAFLFENIRWMGYMDKRFEHMTKAAESYISEWKEEQKIFGEICNGTRPFDDIYSLKIMRKK